MSQTYVSAGRTVAAERGWSWIADAWALFKRNPGMWIGIIVVFALLFAAMSVVPLVGPLASVVLAPVFTGGLMLGCRALEERGELTLGHLFAGFRDRFGTLAAVGALYLAATLVIVLIVVLVMGAGVLAMVSGNPAALAAGGVTLLLAVLLGVALSLPAMMAVWFAPALVVFHEQGAMQAHPQSSVLSRPTAALPGARQVSPGGDTFVAHHAHKLLADIHPQDESGIGAGVDEMADGKRFHGHIVQLPRLAEACVYRVVARRCFGLVQMALE